MSQDTARSVQLEFAEFMRQRAVPPEQATCSARAALPVLEAWRHMVEMDEIIEGREMLIHFSQGAYVESLLMRWDLPWELHLALRESLRDALAPGIELPPPGARPPDETFAALGRAWEMWVGALEFGAFARQWTPHD